MTEGRRSALRRLFHRYGVLVGTYPLTFIVVPALFPIILLPCAVKLPLNPDVITLFGPHISRTPGEQVKWKAFHSYTLHGWDGFLEHNAKLLAVATDADNSSVSQAAEEISSKFEEVALNVEADMRRKKMIASQKTVFVKGQGLLQEKTLEFLKSLDREFRSGWVGPGNTSYRDVCQTGHPNHCPSTGLQNSWFLVTDYLGDGAGLRDRVTFAYPVYTILGERLMIGAALYDVTLDGGEVATSLCPDILGGTFYGFEIVDAGLGVVRYEYRIPEGDPKAAILPALETSLRTFYQGRLAKLGMEAVVVDFVKVNEEIMSIIPYSLPWIGLVVVVLLVYLVVISWPTGRVAESLLGFLSVLLALIGAFLFLFALEAETNPMVVISPFLALAIGIDDAFLIIQAWKSARFKTLDSRERLGLTLADSGMPIVLTTSTDVVCFAFGYFYSPSKALVQVCLYTMVVMFLDFVYQITFFPAVLICLANREQRKEKQKALRLLETEKKQHSVWDFFVGKCLPVILSPAGKISCLVLYVAYVAAAFVGLVRMPLNMTMEKLVLEHSHYKPLFPILEHYIWTDYFELQLLFNKVPDLRYKSQMDKLEEIVGGIEAIPGNAGALSTTLWTRPYLNLLGFFGDDYREDNGTFAPRFFSPKSLLHFFKIDGRRFDNYVRWNYAYNLTTDTPNEIVRVFYVNLAFVDNPTWGQRRQIIHGARAVVDKLSRTEDGLRYPEYEVSIHADISPYVDMEDVLVPSVRQSLGLSSLAVVLVTLVVLYSEFPLSVTLSTIALIAPAVVSIQAGVIGGLYYWDVEYDIISSVFLLMTVGFAVDSTVHIAVHHQNSNSQDSEMERISETLEAVGQPILLAGSSTVVCITCVFGIPAYIASCFAKCVILSQTLGMLHGFVFLPVLFSIVQKPSELKKARLRVKK